MHNIWMASYMKAVGEIAELTLCVPPPRALRGGEPSAQMVQQREPLSAAALSLWPALWLLPGLPAAPGSVCLRVCLWVCFVFLCVSPVCVCFLCVWHHGYLASPLLTASRISRQGLLCHWHTTQVHMWSQWNLWHSHREAACIAFFIVLLNLSGGKINAH